MAEDKILVTGATGMLGVSLAPYLRSIGMNVITHGLKQGADCNFDLTALESTRSHLDQIRPTVIVNLAALTDVDRSQQDISLAYELNVKAVENLTAWAEPNQAHLVHISTDQVYDSPGPSKESEITLTNVYALTKYFSEIVASRAKATVLRTNFFGQSHHLSRRSLSDWVVDNLRNKNVIGLFDDVYFSPLSIDTLCVHLGGVIKKRQVGVFNLGSREGLSKYDFGIMLAKEIGLQTDTVKRTQVAVANHLKAYRPKDMQMDSSLFEKTFGVILPTLKEEIISVARFT